MMHQLTDPPRSMPQLTEPPRASSKVNRGKEEGEKLKVDWTLVAWHGVLVRTCRHDATGSWQKTEKGRGNGHRK